MSISENIGGLSNYFSRIWASKIYKGIKESGASVLKPSTTGISSCKKSRNSNEGYGCPRNIFEELGLNYIGPIDGHNIE